MHRPLYSVSAFTLTLSIYHVLFFRATEKLHNYYVYFSYKLPHVNSFISQKSQNSTSKSIIIYNLHTHFRSLFVNYVSLFFSFLS